MTHEELKAARIKLGLSLDQMARMLGYSGDNARSQLHHMETGRRKILPAQRRIVEALLSGWRPKDWENITGRKGEPNTFQT